MNRRQVMGKKIKEEKLTFRITLNEKRKLEKNAKKADVSLSDYIRRIVFSSGRQGGKQDIMAGILVVKTSEILNYIQENYESDKKLEGMVDELWEIMGN